MTDRPTSSQPAFATRALRAGAAMLCVALALGSAGCGMRLLSRHGGATPPPQQQARPAGGKSARPAGSGQAAINKDPLLAARVVANANGAYGWYHVADLALAADSLGAAEDALRASLAIDPAYAPALALLSKLDFDAGRNAEAVRVLAIVRAEPARFEPGARAALLAALALNEDALGHVDAAAAAAAAGAADGADDSADPALVYVLLRGDAPDSATALARDAVHAQSHSAVNQNNYGITRLRAGDAEGARKAFENAIARDPKLPGPYYNLAILQKYYLLDDAAAARAFAAYWERSQADPDSLAGVFAASPSRNLAAKGAGK